MLSAMSFLTIMGTSILWKNKRIVNYCNDHLHFMRLDEPNLSANNTRMNWFSRVNVIGTKRGSILVS